MYPCPHCKEYLKSESTLLLHVKTEHGTSRTLCSCRFDECLLGNGPPANSQILFARSKVSLYIGRVAMDQNQNDNSLVPVGTVDESDIIRDAISFLKHAAPTQLVEIIQKTKEAYKIRRFMYMNDRFFDEFPRFKDTLQL
ncbi:hypothetical protein PV325_007730, partial [Microctonus aethiopoides]